MPYMLIVSGQLDGLTMPAEKLERREVERIQSAQPIIDRRDRAAIPSGGHFVKVDHAARERMLHCAGFAAASDASTRIAARPTPCRAVSAAAR
jgi:hypothetical protein